MDIFAYFCTFKSHTAMHIILVGTTYPYRGGIATFNERLAQQFVKEGHQVEAYTFTLQYPGFLFPGKTQFKEGPDTTGLTIYRRINSVNPFNWYRVGREIRKKNPDLVVFAYWMSFMAPCMGSIAKALGRSIRKVALVHNMLPHEPSLLDKFLPPYFVKQMDGFTTLSQAVVADIDKFDRDNKPKTWSPHPIYDHYGTLISKEEARKSIGVPPSGRYALFFGFIRDYKGLDLLLEAFADPRLKTLNAKLIVAGEFYGDPKPYMDQIERLGIGDRIVLKTDFIPDDQVNLYFSACDIVTQTYKTATQSGVTQIAFHFEKPMLVTNVGGLPEIVPDGKIGYVVEPNAQSIADALVRFYQEEKEASFIENVKVEKLKYDWSKMTQAVLQLQSEIKH